MANLCQATQLQSCISICMPTHHVRTTTTIGNSFANIPKLVRHEVQGPEVSNNRVFHDVFSCLYMLLNYHTITEPRSNRI